MFGPLWVCTSLRLLHRCPNKPHQGQKQTLVWISQTKCYKSETPLLACQSYQTMFMHCVYSQALTELPKQTEKIVLGENIFMFCQVPNWPVHPCPLSATTAAETAAENWSGSAGGSDRMSNPVWYRASMSVTVMITGYVTGRGRKHSFRCVICTETLCTWTFSLFYSVPVLQCSCWFPCLSVTLTLVLRECSTCGIRLSLKSPEQNF